MPFKWNDPRAYRNWYIGIAILVMIQLLILSGKAGVADVIYRMAKTQINQWMVADVKPGIGERFRDVEGLLKRSLSLKPDNAALHDDLGRIYGLAARDKTLSFNVRRSYAEKSLDSFRTAASLRPAYPYTWVDIVLIKEILGQVRDQEFKVAFNNGIELGPWEPGLHSHLIWLGLRQFASLEPSDRLKVFTVIDRALKMHPLPLLEEAKKRGSLRLFCLRAKGNIKQVESYCAEQE